MQSGLLLDVVVGQSSPVLQLFARKDQSLLLRRDALLVLNLSLHILDRIIGLNVQSNSLSGQRLHEDLHGTTTQSQHQVQRRLLLDVVVRQSTSILQLLSRKDQSLLLRWDTLLVLDLGLDILDRIIGLHIQRNRLSGQSLHENLHRTAAQTQHQMQSGLLLDVVVGQSSSILQLLSRENQPLLLRWNTLLILDLGLDILNGIVRLHVQRDGLTRQGLHKDLHGHSF